MNHQHTARTTAIVVIASVLHSCFGRRFLESSNSTSLLQLGRFRTSRAPLPLPLESSKDPLAILNFGPLALDGVFIDGMEAAEIPHDSRRDELLEAYTTADSGFSPNPNGILCQTLLHASIHDKMYIPFAQSGLGLDLARKFDTQLQQDCKNAFTADAWAVLFENYTGSWEHDSVAPHDNVIFGSMGQWLNKERKKEKKHATTWNKFRNHDEEDKSEMESLLRHISASSPTPTALNRILDLGCGDGVETAKVARGLGLGSEDALCLDIVDYVAETVRSNITFLLAPNEMPKYGDTLTSFLDSKQLRGSVSAVMSSVTFHHIVDPAMRVAALTFIRESLTTDGFFLMAEWDNSRVPIDYTIYMDLAHYLPGLFFQDPAPTSASIAKLETEYLSVAGWISLLGGNGLTYDVNRSRLPFETSDNKTVWLEPAEAAERSAGRDFLAVFGR